MNYYLIAKFVHIVGAFGIFVALGVDWLRLRNLRSAQSLAQVKEWMRGARGMQRLGGASMLAVLLSGFYMMAVAHIGAAWLIVAFGALLVLGPLAVATTGRRMAAIQRSIGETESLSPSLQQLLRQPILWIVMQIRAALALGIVFLMTVKPNLAGSLLTIAVAVALGLILALPMPHRPMIQKETTKELS